MFDLTHRKNYEFNQDCILDGVVKKSLVYGKNGIGKSNLGLALFDIVAHLTDNSPGPRISRSFCAITKPS
ncbi:hypothetical protein O5853_28580, partial [Escherichia coli]|nr:hypothetical protein [Escherichia coli]